MGVAWVADVYVRRAWPSVLPLVLLAEGMLLIVLGFLFPGWRGFRILGLAACILVGSVWAYVRFLGP